MGRARSLGDDEIVDEGAVLRHSLGSNSRVAPRFKAHARQGGDVFAAGTHKRRHAHGQMQLADRRPPETRTDLPGPWPEEGRKYVRDSYAREPVGIPRRNDQRRGTQQHISTDLLGDVNSEERQLWVRHRVHEPTHPRLFRRAHAQVRAPKRDDSGVSGSTGTDRETVGPQPCADHGPPRPRLAATVLQDGELSLPRNPRDVSAQSKGDAAGAQFTLQGTGHHLVIDDPGVRRIEGRDASASWLDLTDLGGVDAPESRNSVRATPELQIVQTAKF